MPYFERVLSTRKFNKHAESYGDKCVKWPAEKRCNIFSKLCMDVTIAYFAVHDCHYAAADIFHKYDYVIMNCGHHPAAASHYSFTKFEAQVRKLVQSAKDDQEVARINANQTKFFWLESTAQPLRADSFVHHYRDWRTYHRLYVFDIIAKSAIKDVGLTARVIPAFSSTLSLFDKMCDCAHYPTYPKMPQLLSLLDYMKSDQ